ncbi:MAG: hypothetical protein GTO16_07430 [Candidatus Aminicenantes bacterium]|nr:hypothetical protein [Candidatus Aminicenantes bacterium]
MKKWTLGIFSLFIFLITFVSVTADQQVKQQQEKQISAFSFYTESLIIPPCAFKPSVQGASTSYSCYGTYLQPGYAGKKFYAPVYLPHKAKIASMEVRYTDKEDTASINVSLIRIPMYESSTEEQEMISFTSEGYENDWIIATIKRVQFKSIDNNRYGYYLRVLFKFNGGRLDLTKLGMVKINYVPAS